MQFKTNKSPNDIAEIFYWSSVPFSFLLFLWLVTLFHLVPLHYLWTWTWAMIFFHCLRVASHISLILSLRVWTSFTLPRAFNGTLILWANSVSLGNREYYTSPPFLGDSQSPLAEPIKGSEEKLQFTKLLDKPCLNKYFPNISDHGLPSPPFPHLTNVP